jgi:biopolymer transport protein ExbD
MRIRRDDKIQDDAEMQMTPMIDIVFQLLIFFLLSAKFIALEGQLSSFLPKERGLDPSTAIIDIVNVTFELFWREDQYGSRVQCMTFQYRDPQNRDAPPRNFYSFNPEDQTGDPSQKLTGNLPYGPIDKYGRRTMIPFQKYAVPNFDEIEQYVEFRQQIYRAPDVGGTGKGLPVVVRFEDKVPTQVVVTLLDICKRKGIEDFTIAAKEHSYD